jgi:hypothetical protein
MKDFRSKENIKALERARKKAAKRAREKKYKDVEKKHRQSTSPRRTSKARGDSFTLKGKPTTKKPSSPNFTMPDPKASVPAIREKAGLPVKHALNKSSKKIVKGLSKVSKFVGPLAGAAGIFLQEGLGEGSDIPANEAGFFKGPTPLSDVSTGPVQKLLRGELIEQPEKERMSKEVEAAARASLISKNKENIAQAAIESPELDEKATKKVIEHLNDDKSIEKAARDTYDLDNKKEKKKKKKLSAADQFKQALTFFAPQLIGGAIGGMLEGDEGMIAGYREGGIARDSYIQYKKDLLEANTGKTDKTNLQQAKEWMTKDGKPVIFDPSTGKYVDTENNVVPATKIINAVNFRQNRNLVRSDIRQELSEDKFAHAIRKDSQLSEKQLTRLGDYDASMSAINEIDRLFKDASTGPLIGRVQSMGQLMDSAPEVFNKLKAEASAAKLAYQKATSGLQVNEREMELIASIIPSEKDAPKVFKSKLDVFTRIITSHKAAFANAIRTGQPMKKETVNAIMGEIQSLEDVGIKGQPTRQVKQPRRSVMSDTQRKRLEELRNKLGRK